MTTLPDDLLAMVRKSMEKIPAEMGRQDGPFLRFNEAGSRPPIYWCFNNWAEPVLLARHLDADQPLVAFRSLYGILQGKQAKGASLIPLANAYLDAILNSTPDVPRIIGGNCQSAPIAEAMAHALIARCGERPLFISMEHEPHYSYPGRLVLLFGSKSVTYNPFLKGEDPLPRWTALHPNFSCGIIDGEHGRFFLDPGVHSLLSHIRAAVSAVEGGRTARA